MNLMLKGLLENIDNLHLDELFKLEQIIINAIKNRTILGTNDIEKQKDWKNDFLSISAWKIKEKDVKLKSWKIKEF